MVRRTSLLVPFLVAAICVALRGVEPRGCGEAMTPDEAIASRTSGYTTVEFRVGHIEIPSGLLEEGMPLPFHLVADVPLKGGGKFYAQINGKLLEDLKRLAIRPKEHLVGAVIQVTGTLTKIGEGEQSSYRMVVLDLEKFRVVKRRVK